MIATDLLNPWQDWQQHPGAPFDPPADAPAAFRLLEANSLTDDLLDHYLGASLFAVTASSSSLIRALPAADIRDSFELVRVEVYDHLDRFEVRPPPRSAFSPTCTAFVDSDFFTSQASPAEGRFEIMLSLLHRFGCWITRLQEPVAVMWPCVPSPSRLLPLSG